MPRKTKRKIEKIYIGGWFQRTTLHLSEIYDFLNGEDSPLELDKKKIADYREKIEISSVEMHLENFDFIKIINKNGVEVKIYEDGLIIFGKNSGSSIQKDIDELRDYYENNVSPGIDYIFSLGAPIPKELANIKNIYPYFIVLDKAKSSDIKEILSSFNQQKYLEINKKEFEICRGDKLYIINNLTEDIDNIEDYIEEQIFLREFKSQLHRYLNLHRIIWQRIAEVKERGKIKGSEVVVFKARIERYSKTINLIEARINQMSSYIKTREAIAKENQRLNNFSDVLNYKYESLINTLSYINYLWTMTKNYVDSALSVFSGIQARSTEGSVRNLAVITSMGVGATLIGLFSQKLPSIQISGLIYFVVVVSIGYTADKIMKIIYARRMYGIKDIKIDKNIS
jgi:hypothetical protein